MMDVFVLRRGSRLNIKNGLLTVRLDDDEQQIPLHSLKALHLNRAVWLSGEVLFTCLEEGVDVLLTKRHGEPAGRLWSMKFGSTALIRKNQALFSNTRDGVDWIKSVLSLKMEHQIALLLSMNRYTIFVSDDLLLDTASRMEKVMLEMLAMDGTKVDDIAQSLRSNEAHANKMYFACIRQCLPQQYAFERRSQHPAMDMVNSLLNYAYGILYARVESALIKAGVDPALGVLHRDDYNRPAMVFDVIEVFRSWVDYLVFDRCMQEIIWPEFFDFKPDAVWLKDEGKRILIQTFTDFFEEVINWRSQERSRLTHIDLYAQSLATTLKKLKTS